MIIIAYSMFFGIFWQSTKLFSIAAILLSIQTSNTQGPRFLYHSKGCDAVSKFRSICASLRIRDVECVSTCLSTMCRAFWRTVYLCPLAAVCAHVHTYV